MTFIGKPIDFMKYIFLYFGISLFFIVPGVFSLIKFGLRPSIDFTGGTLIEIQMPDGVGTSENELKATMGELIEVGSIQKTNNNTYIFRLKPINKDLNEVLKTKLTTKYGKIEELRFETVGPTLGKELISKTIVAIAISASLILFYIAYRFKNFMFGVSAILAMFHDSLILLGTFSLIGYFWKVEVDTLFVTALLTILSFSVHDTIVVYDRIRESMKNFPRANFYDLVNKAVNETLGRSVNNSMTIIFMLLALWLMGGETTKWFTFALLIGTVTGTYSSTFTAAPLLILWKRIETKHNPKIKK